MDRYDLYELCVQSPAHLVPLLRAIHGAQPAVLGEDFCGSGALSALWVREVAGGRAIAVDLDPEPLERLRRRVESGAVDIIEGDVRSATDGARHAADVVFVGNFSIGELHTRRDLLDYLRHARARLERAPSGVGVFVCDTYGGESAFMTGSVERDHPGPEGSAVKYTWEQRRADPLTGRVLNALHFRVVKNREQVLRLTDAFVYDWRLWSVPELRDAMLEAGFGSTAVYAQLPDATDAEGTAYVRPIEDPDEVDDSFIVCVAGRV